MEQKNLHPLYPFKDSQSGKWGFKNNKDEVVVSPCWWLVYHQFSEGMCPVINDEKKVGFVDETGKLVIPCNYVHALDFRDGLASVQEGGTFKIGYINHQGETVIPFIYRKGGDFEDGLAMVSSDNGMWGAINHKNMVVFPFKYGWEELYDILHKRSESEIKENNKRGKRSISLRVYDEEVPITVFDEEVPNYQEAADIVSKKYEEYTKLSWCKGKSSHTIGLVTMLDLAFNLVRKNKTQLQGNVIHK